LNNSFSEVNLLETQEHWEINKASTLEQLFSILEILNRHHLIFNLGMLNIMHKKCRNKDLVLNKRYEELSAVTDIIDPNKFPIFSLM